MYTLNSLVLFLFASVLTLSSDGSFAQARLPTDPAEVLEILPLRAGDSTARQLQQLRAEVLAAARTRPSDAEPATRLADRYFDLALARGDPRYVGYADAVVKPFESSASAPLQVMRAQLLQYRHQFVPALEVLAQALKLDPQIGAAHAWRGAIFLVQADYASAQKECDALEALRRPVLQSACAAWVLAYGGHLQQADAMLQAAVKGLTGSESRIWFLTRLGEVAAWRSQAAQAEKHYRDALALGLDDGYLLAAWGDFLLDQNRPIEVVKLLSVWESSDTLLLRLSLAETQLKLPAAAAHTQALEDRFAAAKLRGDTTHRAEEARFWLHLRANPQEAVRVAAANYEVQREPRDARILLEAAIAAGDSTAARPVRDWLARSGFEDPRLRQMGTASALAAKGVSP